VTELLVCGLGALLFVAIIGWCKARLDANDWRSVATTLGDEYDKLFTEQCRLTEGRGMYIQAKDDTAMGELKVELLAIPCGEPAHTTLLLVTINGRQALHEGPRRIGHCVYCAGPCEGRTTECETRVYEERRG
jgi:hypothetical protein